MAKKKLEKGTLYVEDLTTGGKKHVTTTAWEATLKTLTIEGTKRKRFRILEGEAPAETEKKESKAPEAASAANEDKGSEGDKAPVGGSSSGEDLSTLKVDDLKAMAKEKGVEGFGSMKKAELIEALS